MIPYIPLTLGEKTYNLRFGLGASSEFERITKKRVTSLGADFGMETIAQLLFVMMKKDDPRLTIDKVTELIDDNIESLDEVTEIVTEVIGAAFPSVKESPNVKAPKQTK